jgi:MFS family permease
VVAGAVFRGLGILSLAVFTSPWLIGSFSLVMIAAASGVMMPSLQALATITVSEKFSGGVLGIYGSSVSLGIIVGTAFGGQLFSYSPTLPYVVAGLVLVATVLPALLLAQRTHDLKAVAANV